MGRDARKLKARKVEIRRVDTATRVMTNQLTPSDRGLNGLQGGSTSRLTKGPLSPAYSLNWPSITGHLVT